MDKVYSMSSSSSSSRGNWTRLCPSSIWKLAHSSRMRGNWFPTSRLNFSDQCHLCMGEHGVDCAVTVRGNNCGCVTICDTCCDNGWWQRYADAARDQAARQVEDSIDPWTGLVRGDEDSQRLWIEGHDVRPKCLGCQSARIDYLIGVTRPRRSQRTRKTARCAFCR